jgi:hypothetical protein
MEGLVTLLVDAEMTMFRGLQTPVIFLQNVVVDLILGLGLIEAFQIFATHVRRRYQAEPGFITMNMPRLLDALAAAGIADPIVCCNINKSGFRMSGGPSLYAKALVSHKFRAIAMSVFASGAIDAEEAVRWVCSLPNISSIVFGASTPAHIVATRDLVDRYWVPRSTPA